MPKISTDPGLCLLLLSESKSTSGFQHYRSREGVFHFHTVWMLKREERTNKIENREQSSGHWLNSIPEGDKQSQ